MGAVRPFLCGGHFRGKSCEALPHGEATGLYSEGCVVHGTTASSCLCLHAIAPHFSGSLAMSRCKVCSSISAFQGGCWVADLHSQSIAQCGPAKVTCQYQRRQFYIYCKWEGQQLTGSTKVSHCLVATSGNLIIIRIININIYLLLQCYHIHFRLELPVEQYG